MQHRNRVSSAHVGCMQHVGAGVACMALQQHPCMHMPARGMGPLGMLTPCRLGPQTDASFASLNAHLVPVCLPCTAGQHAWQYSSLVTFRRLLETSQFAHRSSSLLWTHPTQPPTHFSCQLQNQPCPRGDSCQYCHSVFEVRTVSSPPSTLPLPARSCALNCCF